MIPASDPTKIASSTASVVFNGWWLTSFRLMAQNPLDVVAAVTLQKMGYAADGSTVVLSPVDTPLSFTVPDIFGLAYSGTPTGNAVAQAVSALLTAVTLYGSTNSLI